MSKPKEYIVENKEYFAWNYEDQTKIKHNVLAAYSKIWLSKLGSRFNTLFFDCHGGCGAYVDRDRICFGSSIIVNKIAKEINDKRGSLTGFVYCENAKENFDNFKKVLLDNNCTPIATFNQPFEEVLLNPKIEARYKKYPTLFFVDPFGYDLNISSLKNLLTTYGSEVIINFMFDFINRFISKPELEGCLSNFFGSNEWKEANQLTGLEREKFLVNIFKKNIKSITNAKYAFAYRLCYPQKNQTYYYLIHLTNHIDGITLMKESFASINNGRVEYLGKNKDMLSLFDLTQIKSDEFYNNILKNHIDEEVTFDKLWRDIVEDTSYTDRDLDEILHDLEKSNRIKILRVTSKRGRLKKEDKILIGG